MFNLAFISLVLWFPVVFFIFERQPLQKAIVFSFVAAWLFLPPTAIPLPGLPDWGKVTATVVSVLVCTGMKRLNGYLRLRPRWFDLPVVMFCLCPLASAVTANEGVYDGLSAVLEEVFRWGIPYFIGRAFLGDVSGNRLLCAGIALGGIIYIPICLFEIRMSPQLKSWVYGIYDYGGGAFGLRYGGYRPMGFLATGLELGWWMCCSTFACYMLWKSGAMRKAFNYPLGPVLGLLAFVTLACKSTGAILQIAIAFFIVHFAKTTKNAAILWAILLIPPAYCIARPTGIWSGESMVGLANDLFGGERAQSLGFRFDQEEYLMRSAMQRPVFGWARNGGFNPPDKSGRILITDGYWIIVFGTMGGVGLASLIAMLNLPAAIFIRKVRPQDWFHPDVAPVATLTLILPLFMIDNLSNAMLNPIYAIAMGSIGGYLANYSSRRLGQGGEARTDAGRPGIPHRGEAALVSPEAAAPADRAARSFEAGRYAEAIYLLDEEVEQTHRAFRQRPSAEALEHLGHLHAFRARCYWRLDEAARSIEEREYLIGLWNHHAHLLAKEPLEYPEFAKNQNDLAWSLLMMRPRDAARVERAADLASRVVAAHPDAGAFWNTLGVAHHLAGNDLAAIKALSNSVNLNPGRGSVYDFYYLALCNSRLGYLKPARAWLGRAEEAHAAQGGDDPELESLRHEALEGLAD